MTELEQLKEDNQRYIDTIEKLMEVFDDIPFYVPGFNEKVIQIYNEAEIPFERVGK